MSKIELLTEEQHKTLRLIDYIGDIPKGTEVFSKDGGYIGKMSMQRGFYQCYEWLKTPDKYGRACKINFLGTRSYSDLDAGCWGARPTFTFSSIDEICTNGVSVEKVEDGIWRIEGRYVPQETIPDRQEELKQMLNNGELKLSKKGEYPKFENAILNTLCGRTYI